MVRSRIYLTFTSIIMFILLLASIVFFKYEAYLLLSLAFIACTMIPFFARFEIRKITGREVVILAILAAVAAIGRIPFAALPSIQTTYYIIIISCILCI